MEQHREGLWSGVAISSLNQAFSSFLRDALIISSDILLLLLLLHTLLTPIRRSSSQLPKDLLLVNLTPLRILSAAFNSSLGLTYISYGIWIILEETRDTSFSHFGAVLTLQGITWVLLGLTFSLVGRNLFPKYSLRILSVVSVVFTGILCISSLITALVNTEVFICTFLNIMSFPGAIFLMICVRKGSSCVENEGVDHLYVPLNGKPNGDVKGCSVDLVTPFSRAGFLSKMSFWWLNALMKRGAEKTLEDDDIPLLREEDSAEACYTRFMEEFDKKKLTDQQASQPSILWTVVACHWKDIFISGFFALLKILTLSAGPLLLNAFIEVAQGNQSFKYEGYLLTISLFFAKSLESLSQRQWYFRCRLIGMKLRSLLTAAIYKKQLRLSNAARMTHSGGEIMNYVTVDAYRIEEFPYWFHQTWTTSLQLCIALVIVFHAVGYATFAAFVVIIFTVVCNSPLAKLQHKFQPKLMVTQDERLKASSERS